MPSILPKLDNPVNYIVLSIYPDENIRWVQQDPGLVRYIRAIPDNMEVGIYDYISETARPIRANLLREDTGRPIAYHHWSVGIKAGGRLNKEFVYVLFVDEGCDVTGLHSSLSFPPRKCASILVVSSQGYCRLVPRVSRFSVQWTCQEHIMDAKTTSRLCLPLINVGGLNATRLTQDIAMASGLPLPSPQEIRWDLGRPK